MLEWSKKMQSEEKSQNTINSYVHRVQRFAAWFEDTNGEQLDPGKVTSTDLREYKAYLQNVLKQKAQTVNLSLNALRSWLQYHSQDVTFPDFVEKQKAAPQALTKLEEHAFIRAVERGRNKRDIALIGVMLNAGLRISEVVALDIEDLSIGERSGSALIRQGKGNKERKIPLNKTVRKALLDYIGDRKAGPVFLSQKSFNNSRLTTSGVGQVVAKYAFQARLPNVHPHILRHTFAKNLLDKVKDLNIVASILGHESIATTSIYTMPTDQDLQRAVDDLDI